MNNLNYDLINADLDRYFSSATMGENVGPPTRLLSEIYQELTGDQDWSGCFNHNHASISATARTFPSLVAEALDRALDARLLAPTNYNWYYRLSKAVTGVPTTKYGSFIGIQLEDMIKRPDSLTRMRATTKSLAHAIHRSRARTTLNVIQQHVDTHSNIRTAQSNYLNPHTYKESLTLIHGKDQPAPSEQTNFLLVSGDVEHYVAAVEESFDPIPTIIPLPELTQTPHTWYHIATPPTYSPIDFTYPKLSESTPHPSPRIFYDPEAIPKEPIPLPANQMFIDFGGETGKILPIKVLDIYDCEINTPWPIWKHVPRE